MRGLKLIVLAECHVTHVAPYVGAWIETTQVVTTLRKCLSHPTWVRGLKPRWHGSQCQNVFVAPYVGAWIETQIDRKPMSERLVAPYVGAWIETECIRFYHISLWSHPTWVRGLKLPYDIIFMGQIPVAPYVGAWIET